MISEEKLTQKLSIWGFVSWPLKKRKEIITLRAASCLAGRRQKTWPQNYNLVRPWADFLPILDDDIYY